MTHRPLLWLAALLLLVGCSTQDRETAPDGGAADAGVDVGADQATDATVDTGPSFLSLASLTVTIPTEAGPSQLPLVPMFSPSTYDYYVRCTEGINALSVTMTASSGAESSVLLPLKSGSEPSQTVGLNVVEGTLIELAAVQGTSSAQYFVRCLPHDFPQLEMSQYADAGTAPPGYYLVGNTSAPAGESAYAMVLDINGVPLWYLNGGASVTNVDSLSSGVVSYIDNHTGLGYENHQLAPPQTSYVETSGQTVDVHEMRVLPNGDYLVFTAPTAGGFDLTGLTLPLEDGGMETFGPNSDIRQCIINEVDSSGDIVWQWIATDHFDPVKDMTYPSPPEEYPGLTVVEPFHCNSIDVDANGNLLVSARHMDSVFYIERSTGKVLWKMGGSSYSTDNATFIPVKDPFYRQHDARFQASWKSSCSGRSGAGEISVFDDETGMTAPARGVVYTVNVGTPGCGDAGAPSAEVAWQYKGTEPVSVTGSFRVLPGGGGIIGWGTIAGFAFTEVDANGNDLRELHFPDGNVSYRAIKMPTTAFDPDVLRQAAGYYAPVVGAPPVDGGTDASSDASSDAGDDASVGKGCYVLSGSGLTEQCAFTASTSPSFSCSSVAGSVSGSCPASGLYGCCVETQAADGGAKSTTATCYYSSVSGQPASSQCDLETYEGMPYDWQTYAP